MASLSDAVNLLRAADRFWSKVEKTNDCWLWRGALSDFGHGRFRVNNQEWRAHRLSYVMAYGPIPDGLCVCHACDTPACVRPDHFFLGTKRDNSLDAASKGRIPRGERKWNARLTDAQVHEIRARYAAGGIRQRDLARNYSVSQGHISEILNRKKRCREAA